MSRGSRGGQWCGILFRMRVLGVVVVLAALAPLRAQGATVEDLFAHDWQARNRAAAALCAAATVDEKALIEAMGRNDAPPLPDLQPAGRFGGRMKLPGALQTTLDRHRDAIGPPVPRPIPRLPQVAGDLVVPFDARVLAAFVLTHRGGWSPEVVAAFASAISTGFELVPAAAAAGLWRVGEKGATARAAALHDANAAPFLVSTIRCGGEVAVREVAAALREAPAAARIAILDALEPRIVAENESLATATFEAMGSSKSNAADAAARLVAVAFEPTHPRFVESLQQPATAARAASVLLRYEELPVALAAPLLAWLDDESANAVLVVRAALLLRTLGDALKKADVATCRKVTAALERRLSAKRLGGELGVAVVAALGAYADTRSRECEDILLRIANDPEARIPGCPDLAVASLARSRRTDLWTLAELSALCARSTPPGMREWDPTPFLVDKMLAHGEPGLRAVRECIRERGRIGLHRTTSLEFAATWRAWTRDEDQGLRLWAIHELISLGAETGYSEAERREILQSMPLLDLSLVGRAAGWLANEADDPATFEWLIEGQHFDVVDEAQLRSRIRAPIAKEVREDVLVAVLGRNGAIEWPTQELEPEMVRRLAWRVIERDRAESRAPSPVAVIALLRLGDPSPAEAADLRVLLEGSASAMSVLDAMMRTQTLPAALRPDVVRLVDSAAGPLLAGLAAELLWATRPR